MKPRKMKEIQALFDFGMQAPTMDIQRQFICPLRQHFSRWFWSNFTEVLLSVCLSGLVQQKFAMDASGIYAMHERISKR
jgi:hypothetical protein